MRVPLLMEFVAVASIIVVVVRSYNAKIHPKWIYSIVWLMAVVIEQYFGYKSLFEFNGAQITENKYSK